MVSPTISSRLDLTARIGKTKKELREKRELSGLEIPTQTTINNTTSKLESIEEEKELRHEIVEETFKDIPEFAAQIIKEFKQDKRSQESQNNGAQINCCFVIWAINVCIPDVISS